MHKNEVRLKIVHHKNRRGLIRRIEKKMAERRMTRAQQMTSDPHLHERNALKAKEKFNTGNARMGDLALVARLYADQETLPFCKDPVFTRVNDTDEVGRTILHYLAAGLTNEDGEYYEPNTHNVSTVLEYLTFVGADPDVKDITGKTPLHNLVDRLFDLPDDNRQRVYERSVICQCISALLEQGADTNIRDNRGLTCFERAALFGAEDALRVIQENTRIGSDTAKGRQKRVRVSSEYTGVYEPMDDSKRWKSMSFKGWTLDDFKTESQKNSK